MRTSDAGLNKVGGGQVIPETAEKNIQNINKNKHLKLCNMYGIICNVAGMGSRYSIVLFLGLF